MTGVVSTALKDPIDLIPTEISPNQIFHIFLHLLTWTVLLHLLHVLSMLQITLHTNTDLECLMLKVEVTLTCGLVSIMVINIRSFYIGRTCPFHRNFDGK